MKTLAEEIDAVIDRPGTYDDVVTVLEKCKAALASNERDAERYRWWTENYGAEFDGPGTMKLYTIVKHGKVGTKAQFDAAVDTARAGGEGK